MLKEFAFVQPYVYLTRGLFLFSTFQYFFSEQLFQKPANYSHKFGLQYFPLDRLEFRFDYLATQTLGETTIDTDDYTLLFQVHVWL